MFTGIFVLRIRVCTNIEAGAAEENFVPHIPLVPSVLFTAGTEPCFKTTVYSRIFEFRGKKRGLKKVYRQFLFVNPRPLLLVRFVN